MSAPNWEALLAEGDDHTHVEDRRGFPPEYPSSHFLSNHGVPIPISQQAADYHLAHAPNDPQAKQIQSDTTFLHMVQQLILSGRIGGLRAKIGRNP